LLRVALACALGGAFIHFLSAKSAGSRGLQIAAAILAGAYAGSLAWTGHAIGGQGIEGVLHPAADVLHLIAAAAWVGALAPLALLLAATETEAATLTVARDATRRFSTLGIASVATLLVSGLVNSWYLVGGIPALTGTDYGRLLIIKLSLFLVMVAIAAVNRLRLTPKLVQNADLGAARQARRRLRVNAAIEALLGATIIVIVAVMGTLPPASHAHHEASRAIPADASFQHIHTEDGMANVTVEPGHVGTANVTIQLWDADGNELGARQMTLTLVPPAAGAASITRPALQDSDGLWHVERIKLLQPGDWTVTVNATLGPDKHVVLSAPIVIDAK
ncbi:MAG: CopD family protein, partial [Xanthobacteraceae bacterium]